MISSLITRFAKLNNFWYYKIYLLLHCESPPVFKIELRQNCSGRESWRRSKKTHPFFVQEQQSRWDWEGQGEIVPPYCGRNRSKPISLKKCWITTCVLTPLDFQTFHLPWKKLVKKGLRPPRLRSGSEISSSRDIRRQILWLIFFFTHTDTTPCVCVSSPRPTATKWSEILSDFSKFDFLWGSLIIRFGNWRNFSWRGK